MRHPHALLALALLLACPSPPPPPPPTLDAAATFEQVVTTPDGEPRRRLIGSLRRAAPNDLHPLLTAGFASPEPARRVAAALVAGRRADGPAFAAELLAAAADPAPDVRVAAARALGALRLPAGFAALQPNLSHGTAAVRLAALRGLARIDPDRAAALPELARLQLDPDPAVAGAATKVARKTLGAH